MKKITPIFPLELVVYPGELLHLHIFEPRYRQLIGECAKTKKPFGIPSVVNKKVGNLGTLVELVEITEVHDGGELDIATKGLEIFRMTELVKTVPGKLYSGAVVEKVANDLAGDDKLMREVLAKVKLLLHLLKVDKTFKNTGPKWQSYDVAHHAGLALAQEYELLGILTETRRLEYLNEHLAKILPLVTEMESLKEKVQLNGHFKALPGFEIDM
jgi:Lon protease-like protein